VVTVWDVPRPEQAARDVPEDAVDEDPEGEVLVDTGHVEPASPWIYLRGWLRIGLLISPTVILGIGFYLALR
jgi:hypothetical protein